MTSAENEAPQQAEFEARLRRALELELPYADRIAPLEPRPEKAEAAVLLLFGERAGEPCLLVTRRTETVLHHKGQMAFPGGRSEMDELIGEGMRRRTALRETEEEVGIPSSQVRVLGELPELLTITAFRVTPVVGVLEIPLSQVSLSLNADEIAEALWVPLSLLKSAYRSEELEFGGMRHRIHVFQVGSHRIWGATGSMIKNLLDRLAALG